MQHGIFGPAFDFWMHGQFDQERECVHWQHHDFSTVTGEEVVLFGVSEPPRFQVMQPAGYWSETSTRRFAATCR